MSLGIYRLHKVIARLIFFLSFMFCILIVHEDICYPAVKRIQPAVGIIARAIGDAQIRFVEQADWQEAEVDQDLLTGDGLRTGPLGSLALLFDDRTQIRIHRNSLLTIKAVVMTSESANSVFRLNQGGAWARSARDNSGVRIETPSATAAIRGTDWSLNVDENGRTTLIVLDGIVSLENPYGQINVSRGEIAFAEIGRAPSKTILVFPSDREQIYYNMSLAKALGIIKITNLKTRARRQAKDQITVIDEENRTPSQWLDLAELAYDNNDFDLVRQCLLAARVDKSVGLTARADLIRGYLAISDLEYKKAQKVLASAQDNLNPQRRLTAMIGRAGALLMNREIEPARSIIQQMSDEYGSEPGFLIFQVVLTAFAGDLPQAASMAENYSRLFQDQSEFPAMEGVLALFLGRQEAAENAAKRVLAIDPEAAFGFLILGTCQSDFFLDKEAAIQTFQKGLGFNENDTSLWGAMGSSYYKINEIRLAEDAFLKALSLSPNDLVLLCNYVILLLDQSRMDEAAAYIERLVTIEPSREVTLILQGRQALQTNRMEKARDFFLKATTVNPAMPPASLGLAVAYYQNGEPDLADQALANASRLDPNNPEIPLVGATMAFDQARADDAIAYARQAIEKYRLIKGVGITSLAATRGAKNTLGGAFMNLSLNSWADYYNELSFDAYSADSHFYRALQSSDFSSLYQGLMLEPLAVSSRNRHVDFYRRPFTDSAIGGSVNWPDKGTGYSSSGDIQGFDQSCLPLSYFLSFEAADFPGDVENSDTSPISGIGFAGMNITPHDRLFVGISGTDTDKGLPGTCSIPDTDDELQTETLRGEIGYSHSFASRNILMGYVSAFQMQTAVHNSDPLGSTKLSSIDYSLISSFGPDFARVLHEYGLIDVTDPADPDAPLLMVGDFAPTIANTIPAALDVKTTSQAEIDYNYMSFQCRHMFTVDTVEFSYGAEALSSRTESTVHLIEFSQRDQAIGTIYFGDQSLPFMFGDPAQERLTNKQLGIDGKFHVNALWRIDKTLWIEGGTFVFRYDDDADTQFTKMAPRTGIAWQVDNKNWLRIMARKDVQLPEYSSLSPSATVGLFNDMNYVDKGGRSTLYLARWDREWFPHLFTALKMSCQDIHGFVVSGSDNSFESYTVDYGRINELGLGINLWIRGGIGVFVNTVFRDATNRSHGVEGKPDLPLIPRKEIKTGVTWVHPSQIRVNIAVSLIGNRPGDPAAASDLDDYVTTDASVSWQPLDKHMEVGCSVENLFDVVYDRATDMPAPGQVFSVNAKLRF